MKITKALLAGAVAATALTANQDILATDFSPSDLSNRAIAASPRAREQFPWLTRQAPPRNESTAPAESALSAIKKNRALAASPRVREQFPELARGEQPSTAAPTKSGNGESELTKVVRNRALAASPRMREQFPELARRYTLQPAKESFEIAPLK
jgi:hypothetical protein